MDSRGSNECGFFLFSPLAWSKGRRRRHHDHHRHRRSPSFYSGASGSLAGRLAARLGSLAHSMLGSWNAVRGTHRCGESWILLGLMCVCVSRGLSTSSSPNASEVRCWGQENRAGCISRMHVCLYCLMLMKERERDNRGRNASS